MKSKQRFIVLALATPLLLWGAAKVYRNFFYTKPAPQQITLGSPQVLVANLPFALAPRELSWSPDGKYIALGGSVGSMKAPRQISQGVVVVAANSRRIVARFKVPESAAQEFYWSADGRLWVAAGDGWNVYEAPFRAKIRHLANSPKLKNVDERVDFNNGPQADPDNRFSVSLHDWDEEASSFKVEVRKQGRPFYDVALKPHSEVSDLSGPYFSPDGSMLALTVSGLIGIESEGAEELWILDLKTRQLRFLHGGKAEFGWDNAVQSLRPVWSADGKSILFGDDEFGIEEINVDTGESAVVLEREWAGRDAELSPSGKWIGFSWTKSRDEVHYADRMAVASRDGNKWSLVPQGDWPWAMEAWSWHPKSDVLAWAARKNGESPCNLYLWRIQEKPAAQ